MKSDIQDKIKIVRGMRVIMDSDLAVLYGISTGRLNEQVSRNLERFPEDFMFTLSFQELRDLISHFAISSHGGRRKLPRVFTEYGAVMAANVLNSKTAIQASIMLVRVFIRLKEMATEHADLKRRLSNLEQRVVSEFSTHAEELKEIRFLIARLESNPEPKKRRIGF